MRAPRLLLWLPVLFALSLVPTALAAPTGDADAAIRTLLTHQAADWNRGDLEAFATGYKNSAEILFMGKRVSHGYAGMLEGYKKAYPTREKMGTLTFSELDVQPLDDRFATATGHFHLQRTAKGGGDAQGFFLLVLEKTAGGWKIVRDDTTALPTPRPSPTRTPAAAPAQ